MITEQVQDCTDVPEDWVNRLKTEGPPDMYKYKHQQADDLISHPCPACGRCPTCGRGGWRTWPYVPYYPYIGDPITPYPGYTWISASNAYVHNGVG